MNDTAQEQINGATNKQRFLTLQGVADELNTSQNQIYALVRQGELAGIKIGGRGQWRVGRDDLENYIERLYAETRAFIEQHPYDPAAVEATGESEAGVELLAMSNPQPPAAAAKQTPARVAEKEPEHGTGPGL